MTFSKQIPATIITTNTKIPNIPDFSFTNFFKKNMFVNGVEIITSPEFSRKGVIIIAVDNNILFDSRDTNGFENVAFMPINLNAVFERDRIVTVSAFNQVDTNKIEVTINVFIDEVERTLNSALQYFSQDVVNRAISDGEVLFSFRIYNDEVVTQLLDMKGYLKLIVNIASQTVEDAILVSEIQATLETLDMFYSTDINTFAILYPNPVCGSRNDPTGPEVSFIGTYDLGGISPYALEFDLSLPSGQTKGGSYPLSCTNSTLNQTSTLGFSSQTQIEESDFPNTGFTIFQPFTTSIIGTNNFAITKRFIRITIKASATVGQANVLNNSGPCLSICGLTLTKFSNVLQNGITITNIFNSEAKGGTAGLSFEELDVSNNVFTEYIDEDEFGTVTEGQAIKAQIGDVNNISLTGKAFLLPSTQTGFRAKLTVTGGGIETGVSIRRVS